MKKLGRIKALGRKIMNFILVLILLTFIFHFPILSILIFIIFLILLKIRGNTQRDSYVRYNKKDGNIKFGIKEFKSEFIDEDIYLGGMK